VLAAATRSPLTAVVALGLVGYGIALLWVLFGAPDLGLTQLLIETLTVLLLVFVFYHLPLLQRTTPGSRARDVIVSVGVGALMTTLLLAVAATPTQTPMRDFYVDHSQPLAHGRNIVNTILVDFRALDTFGEITVIAISAVGVLALLGLLRRRGASR
jgi:multicomponent Na+:H+ antiporter subunit A